MKYILINFTTNINSVTEDTLDNQIFKEYPFSTKTKDVSLSYTNILIPYQLEEPNDVDFKIEYDYFLKHISLYSGQSFLNDINVVYSLFNTFRNIIKQLKTYSIDILNVIEGEKIDILYTDGSFSKNQNAAAYACCKLLKETASVGAEKTAYDDFTNKLWEYQDFSGRIENGTNNIGELTGIGVALDNIGDKPYQLIISDSMYSIKCFREYIYNWRKNGYKTYNKKDIKNKDLIISIFDKLLNATQNKIVLFKWTEGHADNSFNEICDELAKGKLGIEK